MMEQADALLVWCREIHGFFFYKTAGSRQTFIFQNHHLFPVRVIAMDEIKEHTLRKCVRPLENLEKRKTQGPECHNLG